jgi:hypothetical protein
MLDRFEMARCQMLSTPWDVGHMPYAILADEQPFNTGLYQKAIGSILYAALGT